MTNITDDTRREAQALLELSESDAWAYLFGHFSETRASLMQRIVSQGVSSDDRNDYAGQIRALNSVLSYPAARAKELLERLNDDGGEDG